MQDPQLVLEEGGPDVVCLTLNRPNQRNALNASLLQRLLQTLERLSNDSRIRALILTGSGGQAFCAGADLRERQSMTPTQLSEHTDSIRQAADLLARFPVPVVAAIRGFALAGGAELTLACDRRVASPDAVLGFPEIRLGIFPGAGGALRLLHLIGPAAARDLLFSGRQIAAAEALKLGLVQQITADPLEAAREWAQQVARGAPLAVRALKRALDETQARAEDQRIFLQYRRPLDGTADYAEGLAAFNEKRPPVFRGQ